jgi:hypothetical protein
MTTQETVLKENMDTEMVELQIKKKYLDLFKEICRENNLNPDKELLTRLEEALIDSFSKYSSRCMHEEHALKFLKGGKGCKRVPGFDFQQIEKILSKMDTLEEQVDWLKNYLQQLQHTRETMYFNSRGLNTLGTAEENFTGLSPYMQVYPQAIAEVQKKLNELEAEAIVKTQVTHKM